MEDAGESPEYISHVSDSLRGVVILLWPGRRLSSSACKHMGVGMSIEARYVSPTSFQRGQAACNSAIKKQQHLYLLLCDGEPRWYAIYDAAYALAMRLSKCRHTERVAKCVSARTDRQRELPTAPATALVQRHSRPQTWLEHVLGRRQASFHAMRPQIIQRSGVGCGSCCLRQLWSNLQ